MQEMHTWLRGWGSDLHFTARSVTKACNHSADNVLIEEAGSGISLIQDLRRNSNVNVIGTVPRDDKATRLVSVSPQIEAGKISRPEDALWLAELRRELVLHPNGKHDD